MRNGGPLRSRAALHRRSLRLRLDILLGLHRYQGLAIIVVEQSLEFIRSLSQRILLMEKGRLTGEVAPDELSQAKVLGSFLAAE